MKPASFTIEFGLHVPVEKRQWCPSRLVDDGASVEQDSERVFRVVCTKLNQLTRVGWALFHTQFSNMPCSCNIRRGEIARKRISTPAQKLS